MPSKLRKWLEPQLTRQLLDNPEVDTAIGADTVTYMGVAHVLQVIFGHAQLQNQMKNLLLLVLLFAGIACSTPKKETASEENDRSQTSNVEEQPADKNPDESPEIDYDLLAEGVRDDIRKLDSNYTSIPYYCEINGQLHYIVYNGKLDRGKPFSGSVKYGIVKGSTEEVLPVKYDKVYNPGMTVEDCFEIKLDDKVGLFNYVTGEVLEPQFEFLMPFDQEVMNTCYGSKDGKWYKIYSEALASINSIETDINLMFKNLAFDIRTRLDCLMINTTTYGHHPNDPKEGNSVFVVPSYLEEIKAFYREMYYEPKKINGFYSFRKLSLDTKFSKTIGGQIEAVFYSIFEPSIGGRGLTNEAVHIATYHSESQNYHGRTLVSQRGEDLLCIEIGEVKAIGNLLQCAARGWDFGSYNYYSKLRLYKIKANGEIDMLESDREFDFTKYALIDSTYFHGCFITYIPDSHENVEISGHLNIEDLDVMRNEIFAEYGYRFTSKKWQDYFARKKWYRPKYDNVDHLLTDIDKVNIKVILATKKKMEGREEEYLKTERIHHVFAG